MLNKNYDEWLELKVFNYNVSNFLVNKKIDEFWQIRFSFDNLQVSHLRIY